MTDERLKAIKQYIEFGDPLKDIDDETDIIVALIARLEAAERVCNASEKLRMAETLHGYPQFPEPWFAEFQGVSTTLAAWRHAAGKE